MEILLTWLLFAPVVGVLASRRGRSGFKWFVLALVVHPVIAFILLVLVGRKDQYAIATPKTHVLCPDCFERIRKEAVVCRHCGCRFDGVEQIAARLDPRWSLTPPPLPAGHWQPSPAECMTYPPQLAAPMPRQRVRAVL